MSWFSSNILLDVLFSEKEHRKYVVIIAAMQMFLQCFESLSMSGKKYFQHWYHFSSTNSSGRHLHFNLHVIRSDSGIKFEKVM